MPSFGLGLYQVPSDQMKPIIDAALTSGYRLFDTAARYNNEKALGDALRDLLPKHNLSRDNIWITSKLGPKEHGYEQAKASLRASVATVGMGPLDLYLVHWPGKGGLAPESPEHRQFRHDTWQALEEGVQDGLTRFIGVSNYEPEHLEELLGYSKIAPLINQVELHPLFPNTTVVDCCKKAGIQIQAYSSLAQGKLISKDFIGSHLEIAELIRKKDVTAEQLFLAWALRRRYAVIPKSVTPSRIKENILCLEVELNDEEMEVIDKLKDDAEAGKVCWDPSLVK
jgi:diketogulonate reductase-like aldo/keto reductase